jgi:hypothetical protein
VKPSNCLFIHDQLKLADPRLMTLNRLVLKACQSDRNARCTVTGVSAETHLVVLKRQGLEDLVLGQIDFNRTREVVAHWPGGDGQNRAGAR